MTREEIKTNIRQGLTCYDEGDDDLIALIDEIYDDFESRTCENCKYFTEREDISHLCTMGNSCGIDEYGIPTVLRTWRCSEWEAKDD